MPKVVFFNNVHTDGKGDFEHLMTIVAALKKMPALQNFQFYAVVNCTLWPKEDFEEQLNALNIDGCFLGRSNDPLWENAELQQHLFEAVQIILVSRQAFPLKNYLSYINPNAIFKFIGEHEEINPFMLKNIGFHGKQINFILRPMGLSRGTYGIKLQDRLSQIIQEPFAILQSHDPQFYNALLTITQSPNIKYFKRTHFFVPTYYSNMGPFCKLLFLFIINNKLPQDHNIAIFLSGKSNLIKNYLQELFTDEIYKDIVTTVRQVALIQAQGDAITLYPLNPKGTRSIQVFAGFRLSDAGFDAAFNAASFIAGVSGDNTFERTVSTKLLPFYWSTNENLKKKTVVALANIVQERLNDMNVAKEIKRDLLTFFNYDKFSSFINFFRNKEDELAALYEFKNLDLIAMTKVWSEIAQYIIEHHNFYDRLLNIFSEGLDPALFLTNTSVVPAAASATGIYAYPQISQWRQKPENVSTSGDKPIPPEAQSSSSLKNK